MITRIEVHTGPMTGVVEFELERVDIDSDEDLLRRHLESIPVIELDGEEVSRLGLDADALRARLATVSP